MAREINLLCNFFFSFMCTNLPADTVDIELTFRVVQGNYVCQKGHTAESTIFTSWSKSVIPFPSLRKKVKAFKEDIWGQMTSAWMPLVPTPTKPPKTPENTPWERLGLHGLTATILLIPLRPIGLICWGQT